MNFDFGTSGPINGTVGATVFGQSNGLSQFDGAYDVRFARSNGAETGNLRNVEFTEDGFVVANFSNGQSVRIFKLPIATFTNVNGLTPLGGNVFAQANKSGEFNLKEAGKSGAATVVPSSIEGSNVELADRLTKMIVSQRSFQANTKVVTVADSLLEDLNRIGRG